MTTEQAIAFLNETVAGCAVTRDKQLIEVCNLSISALRSQQWISVNDRLPEKTGSYLVFYHEWSDGAFLPTYEDCTIRVMRFLDSRKWRYPVCVDKRCEEDIRREVTHWMPLPGTEGLKK